MPGGGRENFAGVFCAQAVKGGSTDELRQAVPYAGGGGWLPRCGVSPLSRLPRRSGRLMLAACGIMSRQESGVCLAGDSFYLGGRTTLVGSFAPQRATRCTLHPSPFRGAHLPIP